MNQARILPLLGPALILYLVAEAAATAGGLDAIGGVVAAVAVVCSLGPYFTRHSGDDRGARRSGALGLACAAVLLPFVAPDALSLPIEVARALGASAAAALLLDLALTVPDVPRALDRGPLLRALPALLGVASAVVGALGVAPVTPLFGAPLIVPSSWAIVPDAFLLVAIALATALRFARRKLGSAPEALASNAWALAGLSSSLVAALVVLALSLVTGGSPPWARGLAFVAALALVAAHVATVDSRRRLGAGPTTRAITAALFTLVTVGAAAAWARVYAPVDPLTFGLFAAATLLFAAFAHTAWTAIVRRALAPYRGRLLDATTEAIEASVGGATLRDLAAAVLPPFRAAALTDDAEPLLFAFDPPAELRIDAAGEAHERRVDMPQALARRALDSPGEVIVRAPLEGLVVRRPALRPLVQWLVGVDALLVVPLSLEGEIEGALVVPRGRRRSAPSLEEIAALEKLGERLSVMVATIGAQRRAQRRFADGDAARKDLVERVETLSLDIERLRAESRALVSGAEPAASGLVAYGPAMRALSQRVEDVAPLDAAALLVAEPGADVEIVARQLHERSGRRAGPFVLADCSAVRADRALAALVGSEGEDPTPGWLRLAASGTLLLVDVPALPLDVQREIAEALATKEARSLDAPSAYPVDVRVIGTSRVAVGTLAEAGAFDAELARWLSGLVLDVPPLRERPEDLPALTLVALERARRVLGREPIGIDAQAMDALLAHRWPGNARELQEVIERAVRRASGSKVALSDLPPLGGVEPVSDSSEELLDGTYAELERRVLARALERAGGNKSAAARALGLKRTTFLDKLRRLERDPAVPANGGDSAVTASR